MQTFICVAESMGCLQSEKRNQKSLCVSWFFISRGNHLQLFCSSGSLWGLWVLHSTAREEGKACCHVFGISEYYRKLNNKLGTSGHFSLSFLAAIPSPGHICVNTQITLKTREKKKKAPSPTYPIYACIQDFIKLCCPHGSVFDWACVSDGASYCFRYLTPKGA